MLGSMLDVATAEFLTFPDFLKATPVEDAGKRFVYCEASKEVRDFQGEKVLAKALADSAAYFRQYGNLDMDHVSIVGHKRGIPNPYLYEIGHPVEVKADGTHTFIKGELYTGDAPSAQHANDFWDSLTKVRPAKRWYPSVGGAVMDRGVDYDASGAPYPVIKSVRWSNIGFSQTPVNPEVPGVSTVPIGLLAKSWTAAGGLALKSLDAVGGTDSSTLTGGAALRTQSLDPKIQDYWGFRERLAGDLKAGRLRGSASSIVDHAHQSYGVSKADASEWTERFLSDLRAGLSKKVH